MIERDCVFVPSVFRKKLVFAFLLMCCTILSHMLGYYTWARDVPPFPHPPLPSLFVLYWFLIALETSKLLEWSPFFWSLECSPEHSEFSKQHERLWRTLQKMAECLIFCTQPPDSPTKYAAHVYMGCVTSIKKGRTWKSLFNLLGNWFGQQLVPITPNIMTWFLNKNRRNWIETSIMIFHVYFWQTISKGISSIFKIEIQRG